jgi:hypothetical protein
MRDSDDPSAESTLISTASHAVFDKLSMGGVE